MRQKPFVIACSTDFYGGDLSNNATADVATCLSNCALQGTCIAVSYVPATKVCYLKNSLKLGLYNPNVIGKFCEVFVREKG